MKRPDSFSKAKERPKHVKERMEAAKKKKENKLPQIKIPLAPIIEVATLKDFCKEKLEEAFWDSIPEAVKDLPEPHMTRFAFFTFAGTIAIFFMLTYFQF